jgi:hypothetical protein
MSYGEPAIVERRSGLPNQKLENHKLFSNFRKRSETFLTKLEKNQTAHFFAS